MRVIVAGVGYRNLRDHSIGVLVADDLAAHEWPADGPEILVEDLSYGPIAVVFRFEDEIAPRRFDRAIFVSAIERAGRAPGTITAYRWDGALPPADEIQRAVVDAVTGVIFLDNTLIVGRHFGALPDEVVVVEIEPAIHEFGDDLSDVCAPAFNRLRDYVVDLAASDTLVDALPQAPLGGKQIAAASAL